MSEADKAEFHAFVSNCLDECRAWFLQPGRMKLTFIARDPEDPEMDVVVTDDDLPELHEVLDRLAAQMAKERAIEVEVEGG